MERPKPQEGGGGARSGVVVASHSADPDIVRVQSIGSGSSGIFASSSLDVVRAKSVDSAGQFPPIGQDPTFESQESSQNAPGENEDDLESGEDITDKSENDSEEAAAGAADIELPPSTKRISVSPSGDTSVDEGSPPSSPTSPSNAVDAPAWIDPCLNVIFIGTFAVFGAVLRVYMGRFFGLDCEQVNDRVVDDWLTSLSSRICVTASGKTEQTGGALFVDLPSNMLGS